MRFKTYLRTLAVIVAALVALKVGLSVVIDPYDVFGGVGIVERNFEPNTRIGKIRFLSERCGDFDSYVLGTSRVNYRRRIEESRRPVLQLQCFSRDHGRGARETGMACRQLHRRPGAHWS